MPAGDHLREQRVIDRQLRELRRRAGGRSRLSPTWPIDRALVGDPEHRDGRAHLLEHAGRVARTMRSFARRVATMISFSSSARSGSMLVRPRHVGIACRAAHELADRVDRDRTGDLAALVATHAVGDDEQAELGARADGVLVIGATTGDGEGKRIELHALP